MVERLNLKIWLPFLALLLANIQDSYSYQLAKTVLQQLNGNGSQFDAWTQELSEQLSQEEQQRMAWNVQFLENSGEDLGEMQKRLNPHNQFKLYLWMSFYWQLRRSNRLGSDQRLLPHFAMTLRQLRKDQEPHWNSLQLQNMLQSLPRSLRDLVKSRWFCLKHDRDQLYVLPNGVVELGANSNCSMWQAEELLQTANYWLRLRNICELHATWFINMLQYNKSGTYMLLNTTDTNSSIYCIRNGEGYLLRKDQMEDHLENDCHWQLNDCTQLPMMLRRYYKV
ncbi:uncharacterized protein LOC116805127 [Drosophila grimshawi]|uniref:uncharacterized protein LOC116805127 n=1 Tax=Drosophila grimshawi TaxID=7222 RepID=UPI0013EF025C|nr:uncharacterized protein LOC116805127 [Drosophila grimshawi]